jgi:ATP-dependent 26S proteasome regulatory subunit
MTHKRANIAAAIVKLVQAVQKSKVPDARTFEVIAFSLERDGDSAGAAEVRALTADDQGKAHLSFARVAQRAADVEGMRWFDPTDLSNEIVWYGESARQMQRLEEEMAAVPDFLAAGLDTPTRALFVGPSGVGKTLAARWLGWRLGLPVAVVVLDQISRSYMGETATRLVRVFEEAAKTPSIIFLDEIDSFSLARGIGGDSVSHEFSRVTTTLLQRLDWFPPSQIIIAATNLEEKLDTALRRRLPLRIEFGLPDHKARVAMIDRWLARAPVLESVRVDLARLEQSPAELRALAMAAGRAAVLAARMDRKE